MAEIKMFAEQVSQNLQSIGLLATALGCCYVQFKDRFKALKHFQATNFYENTGDFVGGQKVGNKALPIFMELLFNAHDHPIKGVTPKKDQLAVEILRDGQTGVEIDTILVNKNEVVITEFVEQGTRITGAVDKHDHTGLKRTGPWEHQ